MSWHIPAQLVCHETVHPDATALACRIALNVILANPAPLILHTNLVSFLVIYRGTNVGRAYINPLDLFPGSNTVAAEFHYQPADANNAIAEDLLTQYLSTTSQVS